MARDLRLLQFRQELRIIAAPPFYRPVEFPGGLDPVLVRQPRTVIVVQQTGEAITHKKALVPPDKFYDNGVLLEPPQFSSPKIEGVLSGAVGTLFRVAWTYVMAVTEDDFGAGGFQADQVAASLWPTSPAFLGEEEV